MTFCLICGHEEEAGAELCAVCIVRTTRIEQAILRRGQRIAAGYLDSD